MDTVTATAKKKTLAANISLALLAVSSGVAAAELSITPQSFLTTTYSDNVNLSPEADEESSFVGILGAGVTSQVEFVRGFMQLAYTARQTAYSHDSERNEFYNELYFDAEKELGRTGVYIDGNASITPISRGADVNALTDYISGDTIESQSYALGVGYRSNPAGYIDLNLHLSGSIVRNEDELADNDGQLYTLTVRNGTAERRMFWLYDFGYRITGSDNSDNENTSEIHRAEFGLQAMHGFSPFVLLYYETYEQDLSESLTRENTRWGPGLRYYWSRHSYLEVNYNFDMDDEFDDVDYMGAALLIQPTKRTRIFAEFSKRFFGDAFAFELSHRNKRLTNSISYREDPISYNRNFYLDGQDLEAFRLEKQLQWNSELTLRRTSYRFALNRTETNSFSDLNDDREDIRYQATLSASRQLRREVSASLTLAYEDYQFESQQARQRDDEYWWVEARMQYQLVAGLNLGGGVRIAERNSDEALNEFQENRIYLNINKRF